MAKSYFAALNDRNNEISFQGRVIYFLFSIDMIRLTLLSSISEEKATGSSKSIDTDGKLFLTALIAEFKRMILPIQYLTLQVILPRDR